MKKQLPVRADGKVSLTLAANGSDIIRIPDPGGQPYREGSQRELAWCVIRLMDGLTVAHAHQILEALEPNIQGRVGRPIGWLCDAVDLGHAEIHQVD